MLDNFKRHDPSPEAAAATPAADCLFKVRDDTLAIPKDKSVGFHTFVSKALCLCKRARQDISTAVTFLTARVREPDKDDWNKLVRPIRCLQGTVFLLLILCADSANVIKWHVVAACAVHRDFKSHTGGTMASGEGSIISMSLKQKLNMKSSTEAKLVGVHDVSPQVL